MENKSPQINVKKIKQLTELDKVFKPKKINADKVIEFMEAGNLSTPKQRDMMSHCGSFLTFIADYDFKHQKLYTADFCKNGFCPMCNYRKSRKTAEAVATIMKAIEDREKLSFIFLTLTVPNVEANELKATLKDFNASFKRLSETKAFKAMSRGYIRKLEITYNEEMDTYHPHFHVIIAVDNNYFSHPAKYISHDNWLKMWQKATKNDTITQVNVKRVKDTKKSNAILEISKYSAKDSDYTNSQEVFETFYTALKGARLITYNAIFRDYKKMYDHGELEEYRQQEKEKIIWFWRVLANWKQKDYDVKVEPLTELGFRSVNNIKTEYELELENKLEKEFDK